MRYVDDKWLQRTRQVAEKIVEEVGDYDEPDDGVSAESLAIDFVQRQIGALLEDLDAERSP